MYLRVFDQETHGVAERADRQHVAALELPFDTPAARDLRGHSNGTVKRRKYLAWLSRLDVAVIALRAE
jgi:hypothetical protein